MNKKWPYLTPGIPDGYFIRGSVPMTKEEVRVLTLAKARLAQGQVVWDIGAGTGSLSVEAALHTPKGTVYAIERDPEGLELIKANSIAFKLDNIIIVEGEAPEALGGLPAPDRVLIGGSGGRLEEILKIIKKTIRPGGRIVVNAVTLETISLSINLFKVLFKEFEMVQINCARVAQIGGSHLLRGMNPVTIISAEN